MRKFGVLILGVLIVALTVGLLTPALASPMVNSGGVLSSLIGGDSVTVQDSRSVTDSEEEVLALYNSGAQTGPEVMELDFSASRRNKSLCSSRRF